VIQTVKEVHVVLLLTDLSICMVAMGTDVFIILQNNESEIIIEKCYSGGWPATLQVTFC